MDNFALVGPHCAVAALAVKLRENLELLLGREKLTGWGDDGSWEALEYFAEAIPTVVKSKTFVQVCLKHLAAVDSIHNMLAFGDDVDQHHAQEASVHLAHVAEPNGQPPTTRMRVASELISEGMVAQCLWLARQVFELDVADLRQPHAAMNDVFLQGPHRCQPLLVIPVFRWRLGCVWKTAFKRVEGT